MYRPDLIFYQGLLVNGVGYFYYFLVAKKIHVEMVAQSLVKHKGFR